MKHRRSAKEYTGLARFARPVLYAALLGMLCGIVLLLLFAVLLTYGRLPHRCIDLFALAALIFSATVSGYLCARTTREKGLLCGFFCGLVYVLLLLGIGIFLPTEKYGIWLLLRAAVLLTAAAVGGVFGVNRKLKAK